MLTKEYKVSDLKSLRQNIAVNFTYDVHFTRGLFDVTNPLLSEVIGEGSNKAKSVIVVVDSGVIEHHPGLINKIDDYANYFADKINLATQPIVIAGGETAKNDPAFIDKIHLCIEQAGLCRHSYVLAIGGGAVMD